MDFTGYQIPFLYMNEILLRYRTDVKDVKDILKKTFDHIKKIFSHIEKEVEKL